MSRGSHRLTSRLACAAISALVFCLAATADAQVVPYKGFGDDANYHPATGDYGGSGNATHLGEHVFAGNVAVAPTENPFVATWQSTEPQVTVAANGDQILFEASGEVTLIPLDDTFTTFTAVWEGDFTPVSGTARFANVQQADEPLKVIAVNDPFNIAEDPVWTFSWELTGEIDLGKKP